MVFWIWLPISLSLVSFIGTWSVYGLAYANDHVCSLNDWEADKYCPLGTSGCCSVPTISASGTLPPENSLFTATINAAAILFLLFSILNHAHVMEKHACHSMLSRIALAFGVVSSLGAFMGGNCNPRHLILLHSIGAAVSFTCICFYAVLLTALTRKCELTGYEKFLFPLRVVLSVLQSILTICYTILFTQKEHFYVHVSAIFEWMLSVNLALFEFSYAVEFCFFSSFMISNLLGKRGEEKPLMMTVS